MLVYLFYVLLASVLILLLPTVLSEKSRLRYFAAWASIFTVTFYNSMYAMIMLPFQPKMRCCSNLSKFGRIGAEFGMNLLGLDIEVRDIHKAQINPNMIVVLNHQSFFDIVGMLRQWDEILGFGAPVAKEAIRYYWPFGLVVDLMGTIFLDRSKKAAAYQYALDQAQKHFDQYKGKKASIMIFPEGSRNDGMTFKEFKQGAFKLAIDLKVPILPIVIARYNFMKYLKYFRSGKLIFKVLDPIATDDYSLETVQELTKLTQDLMFKEYTNLMLEQKEKQLVESD